MSSTKYPSQPFIAGRTVEPGQFDLINFEAIAAMLQEQTPDTLVAVFGLRNFELMARCGTVGTIADVNSLFASNVDAETIEPNFDCDSTLRFPIEKMTLILCAFARSEVYWDSGAGVEMADRAYAMLRSSARDVAELETIIAVLPDDVQDYTRQRLEL